MIETAVSMSICGNRFCVILRRRTLYIWRPRYPFLIKRFWGPRFSCIDCIVSDRGILNVYLHMHVILFHGRGCACLVRIRMTETSQGYYGRGGACLVKIRMIESANDLIFSEKRCTIIRVDMREYVLRY